MIFLSLGWGVQSFAIAAMSALGELPKIDYAIHADTGHERTATYDFAKEMTPWLENHGIKVVTVKADDGGNIYRRGGTAIPAFLLNKDGISGVLPRQCTSKWKIEPLHRKIRELIGKGWRYKVTTMWLGISWDERERMNQLKIAYLQRAWPLVERRITRFDCIDWLKAQKLPVPEKSACIFCPFHSNEEWRGVKSSTDWNKAIEVDESIRGVMGQSLFLHKYLVPLDTIDFRTIQEKTGQASLWQDECDGLCNN